MNPLYEHMYEGLISLLPIRYFTRGSVCFFVPSHLVFMMLMRSCCEKGWVTHSIKVDLKKKKKNCNYTSFDFQKSHHSAVVVYILNSRFIHWHHLKHSKNGHFGLGAVCWKIKKNMTFSCWLLSLLSVRLAGYWHSLSKYFFWPQ